MIIKEDQVMERYIEDAFSFGKEPSALSDGELLSLGDLRVTAFFEVLMNEDLEEYEKRARKGVEEIAEEVKKRAERKTERIKKEENGKEIEKLALFSRLLHDLKRTGIWEGGNAVQELLRQTDTMVVEYVVSGTGKKDYRMEHCAMDILMKEPLSRVQSEGRGKRKREYSVGGEYFEKTLKEWAETLNEKGEWEEGIGKEEAMGRICLFEKDFGSIEGVDNRKVMEMAYSVYAERRDTVEENLSSAVRLIEVGYYALTHQWSREVRKEEVLTVTEKAGILLKKVEDTLKETTSAAIDASSPQNQALQAELRAAAFRLKAILLRAADKLLDFEEEN